MTRRALLLLLLLCGCQRQPAPPQDAYFSIDTLRGATGDTLPLPHTYAMFSVLVRTDTQKVIIGNRLYVVIPVARPDTLTRQEVDDSAPKEATKRIAPAKSLDKSGSTAPALDGWTPPPAGPLNCDTITFRAPLRDAIPGSCVVDSSHFLTDSVWVWVERRYLTAPPWATWMDRYHLVRRIPLAPGQPCTLNTARPAWHKFSVRDRAGNVSCADSIYRGPR